jgi:hypothetical protein
MIKKLIFPVIVLGFFFMGCEKTTYEYLDKSNLYEFKVGDTLLYNGVMNIDTFEVSRVEISMLNSDKTHNFETLGITVTQVNKNCTSYCYGFSVQWIASHGAHLQFRNFSGYMTKLISSNNSYEIGDYTIENVFFVEFEPTDLDNDKNINTIYYTHKYGIIGYKLISGEEFVLDEKCLDGLME